MDQNQQDIPVREVLQDRLIFRRDNGDSITVNINGIDIKLAKATPVSSVSPSISSSVSPS